MAKMKQPDLCNNNPVEIENIAINIKDKHKTINCPEARYCEKALGGKGVELNYVKSSPVWLSRFRFSEIALNLAGVVFYCPNF